MVRVSARRLTPSGLGQERIVSSGAAFRRPFALSSTTERVPAVVRLPAVPCQGSGQTDNDGQQRVDRIGRLVRWRVPG